MAINIALISLYGVENEGLRSISSILQKEGFNSYIIFFKRWSNNDIRLPTEKEKKILMSLLKELNINIVGLSFTSPFFKIAQDISRSIRKEIPAKIIWGGLHATAKPHECLSHCDIVCTGEGEYTMLGIAKWYDGIGDVSDIKNIYYKNNQKIIFTGLRPLIRDLNTLPLADYGGENKFYIDNGNLKNFDPLIFSREIRAFASRGCPFNCSYCYNSILKKMYKDDNYYRIKSPEKAISDIEHVLDKFKTIKKIKFDDDTFVFSKNWIKAFCRLYVEKINLPFEILYNTESFDKWTLSYLKKSGLRRIQVGIQTGSKKEAKNVYNRDLSIEKIKRFAHTAKALKLDVVYDVILDNPLADFEDKKSIIGLLLSLPRPFSIFIYSLTIFPGTELSELLLKQGLISDKDIEGQATKSFHQFRLNFSYPRSREESFIVSLVSLTSKFFIPKILIRLAVDSIFLKKHPKVLEWFARISNLAKLIHVLIVMIVREDMNIWKFKEYGVPKRFLIQ